MSDSRFQDQVPHYKDPNLLERCQEELRNYDINCKGWVDQENHTISYIAAAYLQLAEKYDKLVLSNNTGVNQNGY